jgi:hypothetical protein
MEKIWERSAKVFSDKLMISYRRIYPILLIFEILRIFKESHAKKRWFKLAFDSLRTMVTTENQFFDLFRTSGQGSMHLTLPSWAGCFFQWKRENPSTLVQSSNHSVSSLFIASRELVLTPFFWPRSCQIYLIKTKLDFFLVYPNTLWHVEKIHSILVWAVWFLHNLPTLFKGVKNFIKLALVLLTAQPWFWCTLKPLGEEHNQIPVTLSSTLHGPLFP